MLEDRYGLPLSMSSTVACQAYVVRAERDLIEYTLLAAYPRCGQVDEAEALLRRRVDRQPAVPVRRA